MQPQTIFALIVFIFTYVLMFSFPKIRPHVSIVSALIFIVAGSVGVFPGFSYSWRDALRCIDWNVLMMISGTMGLVFLFIESGMPNRMSDIIVSKVGSVKLMIFALSIFAGIISAFVDNVATVLMIAPVALAICSSLKISPVPAIICISISSNLQGAATLVGDTTSLLLAKAANLDFMGFFFVDGKPGMFWVTEIGALASAAIILWMFRDENGKIHLDRHSVVHDIVPTVLLCGAILSLIMASFIPYKSNAAPGQFYKPDITNGLICIVFFMIGMAHQAETDRHLKKVTRSIQEIDYYTITLLAGLFIVIGGIEEAGLIDLIGELLAGISGSGSRASVFIIYTLVLWMSVVFSAFIDNIPYTATMLPVVAVVSHSLAEAGGLDISPNLLYFGLMVGATLGGNLTPIGASANITGIGILRKAGYEVSTSEFMKYSIPFTITAVMVGYVLLWIIWM